ncbi:MAG: hypothetical protein NC048_08080 [Bacteroides sp.]|nr:hypothetical protein [Ruminococcus flavefaciens]MCM1555437.1 hypothetical protein [Bacteroides sp.]
MQQKIQSFTQRYEGRAFNPDMAGAREPEVRTTALWDTGATISTISKKIADELNLIPFAKSKMFHAGGEGITNLYKVNMFLPNGVGVRAITVIEGILNGCEVLIGMDIITLGDFAITNKNGKTVFSFQTPSSNEYDFSVHKN